VSHGRFDEAVQVIWEPGLCVRRMVCEGVCEVSEVPLLLAPKISDVRSTLTVGPDASIWPRISPPPLFVV
jgi:hypothetical protein